MAHAATPEERLLASFNSNAYSTGKKHKFEEAVKSTYGDEWTVTVSLQSRMQFFCSVCNKEMNSVTAVADHARSGSHQKSKNLVIEGTQKHISRGGGASNLVDKLNSSYIKAVGVKFLIQFKKSRSSMRKPYYLCTLCGCHSGADAMVLHLIGVKHTDNYILAICKVTKGAQPQHREAYRTYILEQEGSGIDDIIYIDDPKLYPDYLEEGTFTHRVLSHTNPASSTSQLSASTPSGVRAFAKAVSDTYSSVAHARRYSESTMSVSEKYTPVNDVVSTTKEVKVSTTEEVKDNPTEELKGNPTKDVKDNPTKEVKDNPTEEVTDIMQTLQIRCEKLLKKGEKLYNIMISSSSEKGSAADIKFQKVSAALGILQKKVLPYMRELTPEMKVKPQ